MAVLPEGAFGERVRSRLRESKVIWLTTVGADGTPQPNPVWFLWDGEAGVRVYNRPDAHRLTHIGARPEIALHLDGDGKGGDIIVLLGTAARAADGPTPDADDAYLAKYGPDIERISGAAATFAADYPVALQIDVRRIRGH
jgi:PPOX class probable F420-dependent enzyme